MQLFALIRTRGSGWQRSLPLEQQPGWDAHAAFMDRLHSEGFVVLGGPLEGTDDVLLIVRANDPADVAKRVDDDPWTRAGLLRTAQIAPWMIRLGSLG